MRKILIGLVFIWFGLCPNVIAQNTTSINEKAGRFHKALLKRPESDVLFDRFFDAWLESDTVDKLEIFLTSPERTTASDLFIAGRYYIRQDQDAKAQSVFDKLVNSESAPKSIVAKALVTLCDIASRKLDYSTALTHIKRAQKIVTEQPGSDPNQLKDLKKREGEMLIRTDRREDGLAAWKELLGQYPDDRFLSEDVILLLVEQGLFDEAVTEQQKLVARTEIENDTYAAVLAKIELGHIYRKANRDSEAIAMWQSTLPATGHDSWVEKEILGLIESTYRRTDNLTGLQTKLKEIIEQQPKRLNLLIAEARIAADLGEDESAIEQWKHILNLTPGNKELRLRFVKTLNELNRPTEAAAQIQNLIASNPDDNELRFTLAEYQYKSNDLASASKSLTKFLDKSDGAEFTHIRVARKLAEFEMYKEAEKVFEDLVQKFPASGNATDAYAIFLYDNVEATQKAIKRWQDLSRTGDINQVLLAARQLSQRFELKSTYEILEKRLPDFRDNYRFLGEYCMAGIANEKQNEVLPLAIHQVKIASLPSELAGAILMTINVSKRIPDNFVTALKLTDASKVKNIKCLHAALLDASDRNQAANQYLTNYLSDLSSDQKLLPLLTLKDLYKSQSAFIQAANTLEKIITEIPGGRKSSHIEEIIGIYGRLKRTDSALKWIREWKLVSPESSRPWIMESRMLEESGQFTYALQAMQSAARRFEEPEVQTRLAKLEIKNGTPSKAEKIYWDLYESTEDDWKRLQWIAEITQLAVKQRRVDQVVKEMQRRQRNNSKSIEPLLALADVYRIADKTKEYRETILAASTLQPENIQLIHRIADLDMKEGNFDSARAQLESVLDRDRTNKTSKRLINLYLATGDVKNILNLITRLPVGNRLTEVEVVDLGKLFISIGELEASAKLLAQHKKHYPDNFELHRILAFALVHSDNPSESAINALLELERFDIPNLNQHQTSVTHRHTRYQLSYNYRTHLPNPDKDSINYWVQQYKSINRKTALLRQSSPLFTIDIQQSPLPSNSHDLFDAPSARAYILSNILNIYTGDQKQLESRIIAAGIPPHEFYLAKHINSQTEHPSEPAPYLNGQTPETFNTNDIQTLFREHSTSVELAEWFLSEIPKIDSEQTKDLDRELLETAYKIVRQQKGHEAAALLALRNQQFDQALADFYQVPHPTIKLISQLLMAGEQPIAELDANEKRNLADKIQQWVHSPNRAPITNSQHLIALLNFYSTQPDRWINLVKTEWVQPQNNITSSYFPITQMGQSQLSVQLHNVSNTLLYALKASQLPKDVDYSTFDDNSILAFWLSYCRDDSNKRDLILAQFKQQESENTASFNELYLLANWSISQATDLESKIVAAKQLEKTQNSISSDILIAKTAINKAIFGIAQSEPKSEQLTNLGIAAVVRLRQDPNLRTNDWRTYSYQIVKWGKPEFKDRPLSLLTRKPPLNPFSTRGLQTLSSFNLPTDNQLSSKLQKLVRAKKVNQAVNIAVKELPIHAGKILTTSPGRRSNYLSYIERSLSQANKDEEVLEACKPDTEASAITLARYAAICETLKKPEKAAEYYQKILNRYPNHSAVLIRRIESLAETNMQLATKELFELTENKGTNTPPNIVIANATAAIIDKASRKDARLDIYSELVSFFGKIDQRHYTSNFVTYGPNRLINYLWQSWRQNDISIPSVQAMSTSSPPIKPEAMPLAKRRDQILIDACKIFIDKYPQDGAQFFSRLAQLYENNNLPLSEITPYCLKCINTKHATGQFSTGTQTHQDPLIWLIETTKTSKDRSELDKILIAKKPKDSDQPGFYDQVNALYHGPTDQFMNNAKRVIRAPSSTNQHHYRGRTWKLISRAAKARGDLESNTFNQSQLSIEILKEHKTDPFFDYSIYTSSAQELLNTKGATAVVEYLTEIESLLVNNKTKSHTNSYFQSIVNTLLQNKDAWFPTMAYLKTKSPETLEKNSLLSYVSRGSQSSYYRNSIDKIPETLAKTSLLKGIDEIEVLPKRDFIKSPTNHHTYIGELFRNLRSIWDSTSSSEKARRKSFNLAIDKLDSDTFGYKLVKALGAEQSMTEAVLSVYHQHLTAIQQLPSQKQSELALLARDLVYLNDLPRLLNANEKQVVSWISKSSLNNRYAELANADKLDDFNVTISNGSLGINSYTFVRKDILFDWKNYFLAMENYIQLGEKAVQTGRIKPQSRSFAQSNLSRAVDYQIPLESLAISLSMFNSDKIPPMYYWQESHRKIEANLEKTLTKEIGPIFTNYVKEIQTKINLDKLDNRATTLHFYRLMLSLNSTVHKELDTWQDSDAAKNIHPHLIDAIKSAKIIYSSRKGSLPEEAQSPLLSLVEKRTKNDLGVRLILAEVMCDDWTSIPYSIVEQSAKSVLEAWLIDEPVSTTIEHGILERYVRETSRLEKPFGELGENILKHFQNRYVLGKLNRTDSLPRSTITSAKSSTNLNFEMIKLAALLGDHVAVNQILNKHQPTLQKRMATLFSIYVENGMHELATRKIKTRWETILTLSNSNYFSSKTQASLDLYCESLKNESPWVPALARVLVETLPDTSNEKIKPSKTLADRIKKLAQDFDPDIYPNRQMFEAALNKITSPETEKILLEHHASLATGLALSNIAEIKSSSSRSTKLRYKCHQAIQELQKGDTNPYLQLLNQLSTVKSNSTKHAFSQRIHKILPESFSADQSKATAQKRIPLYIRVFSEKSDSIEDLELNQFIASLYRAGQKDEYKKLLLSSTIPLEKIVKLDKDNFYKKYRDAFDMMDKETEWESFIKDLHIDIQNPKSLSATEIKSQLYNQQNNKIPEQSPFNISEAIKAELLNRTTWKSTGFSQSYPEVIQLIAAETDVKKQAKYFLHTVKLAEQAMAQKVFNRIYPSNGNFGSDLLRKITPSGTYRNSLELQAELFWRNTPDYLLLYPNIGYKTESLFSKNTIDWSSQSYINLWLTDLYQSLHDLGKLGCTAILLPRFYEIYDGRCSIASAEDLVTNGLSIAKETKNPLAKDFAMAGCIWLQNNHAKEIQSTDWQSYALDILKDKSVSAKIRHEVASFLMVRAGSICNDALVKNSIESLLEVAEKNYPIHESSLESALREFNQLPKDDWWKATAQKIQTRWQESSANSKFTPSRSTRLRHLEILLALELNERIDESIAEQRSYETFILLVKNKQFKRATNLLTSRSLLVDLNSSQPNIFYDESLQKHSVEYLKKLDSPDLIFLANLLIQSAPDPFNHKSPPRLERIKPIASEFKTYSFKNSKARLDSTRLLKNYPTEANLEHEHKKHLTKLSSSYSSAYLEKYPFARFQNGHLDALQELKTTLEGPDAHLTKRETTLNKLTEKLNTHFYSHGHQLDKQQSRDLLDAYEIALNPKKRNSEYYKEDNLHAILNSKILALRLGDSNIIQRNKTLRQQWITETKKRKSSSRYRTGRGTTKYIQSIPIQFTYKPDITLFSELLKDPIFAELISYADRNGLIDLLFAKGLTQDQLNQHESTWAETGSNNVFFAMELTDFYTRQANEQKAKKFANLALTKYLAQNTNSKYNTSEIILRLKLASMLKNRFGDDYGLLDKQYPEADIAKLTTFWRELYTESTK